jgi:hypothetical protein
VTGGRAGGIAGLLTGALWAPLALVVGRFPELSGAAEVEAFWRENRGLMQAVALPVIVGFLPLLAFLAALDARVRRVDATLAALASGSALMFMTALNVAIGLDFAAGLLLGSGSALTYGLHTAGFVLAAPATFAGVAFFVAVAVAAFRTDALPRWSGWWAAAAGLANVGAIGGVLSLSGPLNSGNGILGGIAVPLGAWLVWIVGVSVWWVRGTTGTAPRPADSGVAR